MASRLLKYIVKHAQISANQSMKKTTLGRTDLHAACRVRSGCGRPPPLPNLPPRALTCWIPTSVRGAKAPSALFVIPLPFLLAVLLAYGPSLLPLLYNFLPAFLPSCLLSFFPHASHPSCFVARMAALGTQLAKNRPSLASGRAFRRP